MEPDRVPCQDGCKRSVADMAEAEAKGWTCLPLTARYRCPDCVRALAAVNGGYRYPSEVAR